MKLLFRLDASIQIGSGHVMRCLTLAEALREKGSEAIFVCCELDGNLCNYIEERGFAVCLLPKQLSEYHCLNWNQHVLWLSIPWEHDASETIRALRSSNEKFYLLIVDHSALDSCWEKTLRPLVKKIMIKHFETILGKFINKSARKGTALSWDFIG